MQRPGIIRPTLRIRDHDAVVDILYDTRQFTIQYADSRNLNYDGQNIHPRFNDWVRELEVRIVRESARQPRTTAR
jgi:hypothetical protein